MPNDKDGRKLRHILKAAGEGQQADQSEVTAAVGRSMQYFVPIMVLLFTVNLAAALSLYWFTGGVVAYLQQRAALKDDADQLVEAAESDVAPRTERGSKISISSIPEAEVVTTSSKQIRTKTSKKAKKKRR